MCACIYIYVLKICVCVCVCVCVLSSTFMLTWPKHPPLCSDGRVCRLFSQVFTLLSQEHTFRIFAWKRTNGKMPRVVQLRLFGEKTPQMHVFLNSGFMCFVEVAQWYTNGMHMKYIRAFLSLSLSFSLSLAPCLCVFVELIQHELTTNPKEPTEPTAHNS